ncbi:MAG: hypothetical protein IJK66_01485 [Bacilli bacterium]|nr:hypothetical protein [Bacilli bacterium]
MSYPVKYAVEELKIEGGYVEDYQDTIKGYIVSKCYVIEDRIRYGGHTPYVVHAVTFPYSRFEDFIRYNKILKNIHTSPFRLPQAYYEQRNIPSLEELVVMEKLYDNIEDAYLEAERRNNNLKSELLLHTSSAQFESLSKQIDEDLDLCREYAIFISENTTDMVVDKEKCKVKI